MIPFACYDIETVPNETLPEGCRPAFDESTVALGNLVDRFKIQAKIDDARAKFEAALDKTMSLDPDLCRVCCFVGYTVNGLQKEPEVNIFAPNENAEYNLLASAWAWLRERYKARVPVVSFNGKSFDLQVLRRRAMLLDVSVPPALFDTLTRRFETKHHVDMIEVLANRNLFSGKPEFKSLDYYLKRFGIGSKFNGMSGADVYPLFKEGEYQKILDYCKDDVVKASQLFKRIYPWVLAPTEPEETKEGE